MWTNFFLSITTFRTIAEIHLQIKLVWSVILTPFLRWRNFIAHIAQENVIIWKNIYEDISLNITRKLRIISATFVAKDFMTQENSKLTLEYTQVKSWNVDTVMSFSLTKQPEDTTNGATQDSREIFNVLTVETNSSEQLCLTFICEIIVQNSIEMLNKIQKIETVIKNLKNSKFKIKFKVLFTK